ncbi:DNA polymerase III subunit beta [Aphanizomenon phage vB_AphaS-CL131]|nr:DNA polymerase III subunit beta [Aphanizomenon phage vB_AphaS-CL131]
MITVKTKTFFGMLRAIAPVIPDRPTHPVLANYLIASDGITLSVTATDLEVFAQSISHADGVSVGRVCVPPLVTKLVEKIDATYTNLEFIGDTDNSSETPKTEENERLTQGTDIQDSAADADKLKLTFGSSAKYVIQGMTASEFPEFPNEPIKSSITVNTKEFIDGLIFCKKFVSTDDAKRVLKGIFYDGTKLIATDGHAIANYCISGTYTQERCQIIIPTTIIDVLSKVGELPETITLEIAGEGFYQYVYIAIPQLRLAVRLIEGNYPNTDAIKFSNQPGFVVDRKQLKSALGFHKKTKSGFNEIAQFTAKGNELKISSSNSSSSTENFAVLLNGNSPANTVNSQYLAPQKVNSILDAIKDFKQVRIILGEIPNITTFYPYGNPRIKCGLMQMKIGQGNSTASFNSSAPEPEETPQETPTVDTDQDIQEQIRKELAIAQAAMDEIFSPAPTLKDCFELLTDICDRLTAK